MASFSLADVVRTLFRRSAEDIDSQSVAVYTEGIRHRRGRDFHTRGSESMQIALKHASSKHLLCNVVALIIAISSACSPAPVDPYPPSGYEQAPAVAEQPDLPAGEAAQSQTPAQALTPLSGPASALAAFSTGLQYARQEWKADARLTRLETLEAGDASGLAPIWLMNFHSPSRRLEYLILQVQDGQVSFALQRDSAGPGKPLYAGEWLDSPQAAALAAPFCPAAEDSSFLYALDVNLKGGIEWLVTCGSGEVQHSVRMGAASGDILSDWPGGIDAEP